MNPTGDYLSAGRVSLHENVLNFVFRHIRLPHAAIANGFPLKHFAGQFKGFLSNGNPSPCPRSTEDPLAFPIVQFCVFCMFCGSSSPHLSVSSSTRIIFLLGPENHHRARSICFADSPPSCSHSFHLLPQSRIQPTPAALSPCGLHMSSKSGAEDGRVRRRGTGKLDESARVRHLETADELTSTGGTFVAVLGVSKKKEEEEIQCVSLIFVEN